MPESNKEVGSARMFGNKREGFYGPVFYHLSAV